MNTKDLVENIDKLHTTEMGYNRIKNNLNLDCDVINYCKEKILDKDCKIIKKGKNWYCSIDNIEITINAYSYTIITAHIIKKEKFKYEFFIAGRARNQEKILKICEIFDKYNVSYYCFLKNKSTMESYGSKNQSIEEKQQAFENLSLKSETVLNIFKEDLKNERACKKLLLVLPAGKSGHIEAGIAYGLNKECFAIGEYDATDSLYNIFKEIFESNDDLEKYLKDTYK